MKFRAAFIQSPATEYPRMFARRKKLFFAALRANALPQIAALLPEMEVLYQRVNQSFNNHNSGSWRLSCPFDVGRIVSQPVIIEGDTTPIAEMITRNTAQHSIFSHCTYASRDKLDMAREVRILAGFPQKGQTILIPRQAPRVSAWISHPRVVQCKMLFLSMPHRLHMLYLKA
jgi:hypothetical protein